MRVVFVAALVAAVAVAELPPAEVQSDNAAERADGDMELRDMGLGGAFTPKPEIVRSKDSMAMRKSGQPEADGLHDEADSLEMKAASGEMVPVGELGVDMTESAEGKDSLVEGPASTAEDEAEDAEQSLEAAFSMNGEGAKQAEQLNKVLAAKYAKLEAMSTQLKEERAAVMRERSEAKHMHEVAEAEQ